MPKIPGKQGLAWGRASRRWRRYLKVAPRERRSGASGGAARGSARERFSAHAFAAIITLTVNVVQEYTRIWDTMRYKSCESSALFLRRAHVETLVALEQRLLAAPMAALRELVELKRMKELIERGDMRPVAEYERRKEAAWDAAKALVDAR